MHLLNVRTRAKRSAIGVLQLQSSSLLYIVYAYCFFSVHHLFVLCQILTQEKTNFSTSDLELAGASAILQTLLPGLPRIFQPFPFFVLLDQYKQVDDEYTFADVNCCSHFPPLCFIAAEKKNHTHCLEDLLFKMVICP